MITIKGYTVHRHFSCYPIFKFSFSLQKIYYIIDYIDKKMPEHTSMVLRC